MVYLCISISGKHSTLSLIKDCSGNSVLMVYLASCLRPLVWIEYFLSGRRQRVVANGKLSTWADILSGIPQGSALGPILFVIFINDLPDAVRSTQQRYLPTTQSYFVQLDPRKTTISCNKTRITLWNGQFYGNWGSTRTSVRRSTWAVQIK